MGHFLTLMLQLEGIANVLEDRARAQKNFSRLSALSYKITCNRINKDSLTRLTLNC